MKLSKKVISVALVLAVIASAMIFAIPANGQALVDNVFLVFTGTIHEKGDKISVDSNGKILDTGFSATLYNNSGKKIEVISINSNSSNAKISGFTARSKVESGDVIFYPITGSVTANSVFYVYLTYKVDGYPESTVETVKAYIYASSETTSSATANAYISSGVFTYGANMDLTLSPITSGTVATNSTKTPTVTASIYVDGSLESGKTWGNYGLEFLFTSYDVRSSHVLRGVTIAFSSSSTTGSFGVGGSDFICTAAEKTKTFSDEDDNPYLIRALSTEAPISVSCFGDIPTTATSQITVTFNAYGRAETLGGLVSAHSAVMNPKFILNVYNNNKAAIREALNKYAAMGLNPNMYTTASWNNFETALTAAYTQLGKTQTTAANVSSALSTLETRYSQLVRYVPVITNHYYRGNDGSQGALLQTDYDMQVTNASTFYPKVMSKTQYAGYNYNRQETVSSVKVAPASDSNYRMTVNQYYWYVDTSALEAALAEAKAISLYDNKGNQIYREKEYSDLVNYLSTAEAILNNQTLYQNDMDNAVTQIKLLMSRLSRLNVNTDWLDIGTDWATQILDSNYLDDYRDNWFAGSQNYLFGSTKGTADLTKLQAAKAAAVQAGSKTGSTQAEIDGAADTLWNTIAELSVYDPNGLIRIEKQLHADKNQYGSIYSSEDPTKDGLKGLFLDIIDAPDAKFDDYKLNQSAFTKASWDDLYDALYGDFSYNINYAAWANESYPVEYGGTGGTSSIPYPAYTMVYNIYYLPVQAELNACYDFVKSKVYALEYNINATEVNGLLAQAKALKAENCTGPSYLRLAAAVAAAEQKLEKATKDPHYGVGIPQSELETCIPALRSALEGIVDLTALRARIEEYKGIAQNGTEIYTERSIVRFQEAVSEFEAYYTLDATSVEITIAYAELESKLEILDAIPNITVIGEGISISEEDHITGIEMGNTIENVLMQFSGGSGTLRIENHAGELVGPDDMIATGYKMILSLDGVDYETVDFIILGDVIGEGVCTRVGANAVVNHEFGITSLEGLYLMAADVNQDGKVDMGDAAIILSRI